jgi:hypothetical protein
MTGVGVGLPLGVGLGEAEVVSEGDGDAEAESEGDADADAESLGVADTDALALALSVGVALSAGLAEALAVALAVGLSVGLVPSARAAVAGRTIRAASRVADMAAGRDERSFTRAFPPEKVRRRACASPVREPCTRAEGYRPAPSRLDHVYRIVMRTMFGRFAALMMF